MEEIRLQKYIAECGVASRRAAENMILNGRVSVDDVKVTQLGTKIDPKTQNVSVDGKNIHPVRKKIYLAVNKPVGVVSTSNDQFNRPTVMDLIKPDIKERLHTVGRLDYETEGLLVLTNDGDLTYKVTHPKHSVQKTYIAVGKGDISIHQLKMLRQGVKIDDYVTSPAEIDLIDTEKPGYFKLQITINEGKNRQIRKMFEAVGHQVAYLQRISIGNIKLGRLDVGKWRHLTSHEVNYLKGV